MGTRSNEGERLRREIGERQSPRGRLRRELRQRCEHYASLRAAAGRSQQEIASELGVSAMTVQRWLRTRSGPAALVPVRVVAPPRTVAVPAGAVVTTPRGLRIEGLDLDAVSMLVARFG